MLRVAFSASHTVRVSASQTFRLSFFFFGYVLTPDVVIGDWSVGCVSFVAFLRALFGHLI